MSETSMFGGVVKVVDEARDVAVRALLEDKARALRRQSADLKAKGRMKEAWQRYAEYEKVQKELKALGPAKGLGNGLRRGSGRDAGGQANVTPLETTYLRNQLVPSSSTDGKKQVAASNVAKSGVKTSDSKTSTSGKSSTKDSQGAPNRGNYLGGNSSATSSKPQAPGSTMFPGLFTTEEPRPKGDRYLPAPAPSLKISVTDPERDQKEFREAIKPPEVLERGVVQTRVGKDTIDVPWAKRREGYTAKVPGGKLITARNRNDLERLIQAEVQRVAARPPEVLARGTVKTRIGESTVGVPWAKREGGYTAKVPGGRLVSARNRNDLERDIHVAAEEVHQQQLTREQHPNRAAYEESNDKTPPPNLLDPGASKFLWKPTDRQKLAEFNKRADEALKALGALGRKVNPMAAIQEEIAPGSKNLTNGPELLGSMLLTPAQIGQEGKVMLSDEFTPLEKVGALANATRDLLTLDLPVSQGGKVVLRSLSDDLVKVFKLLKGRGKEVERAATTPKPHSWEAASDPPLSSSVPNPSKGPEKSGPSSFKAGQARNRTREAAVLPPPVAVERKLTWMDKDGKPITPSQVSDEQLRRHREQARVELTRPKGLTDKKVATRNLKAIESEISSRSSQKIDVALYDFDKVAAEAGLGRQQIDALKPAFARQFELAVDQGKPLPKFEVSDFATPGARRQIEPILRGEVEVPQFKNMKEAAAWVEDYARKNPVFEGRDISKLSDEEFIAGIKKHTLLELEGWGEVQKNYKDFFGKDIVELANPKLQEYARANFGRELRPEEVKLYHVLSSLASPARTPQFDSNIGFRMFDRFMRKNELSPFTDKQATAYVKLPNGKKVDTGELRFNEDGSPELVPVSSTYRQDALFRIQVLIDKMGLKGAMEWLGSHHSPKEISEVMGIEPSAFRNHEYMSPENGGFGIFAVTGPKLAAYTLNRWQDFGFTTKDMWWARTMARYTNEPLVVNGKVLTQPWGFSKEGIRRRKLVDAAWKQVADELGVEPARVSQWMWDAEHVLYNKLGVGRPGTYISEGLEDGIRRIEKVGRHDHAGADVRLRGQAAGPDSGGVRRDHRPGNRQDSEGAGRAPEAGGGGRIPQAEQGVVKATFDPSTWMVQLIRGKADVSSSIHEVSGHWFENVLRDHAEYGPIIKRVYGDLGSEKFARHVEQYFLTGKAPVASLKEVFEAIGTWMKQIYSQYQYGSMPKEVRAVFDKVHSVESPRVRELLGRYRDVYRTPPKANIGNQALVKVSREAPTSSSTDNIGRQQLSLAIRKAVDAGMDPAAVSRLLTSRASALSSGRRLA